MTGQEEFDELLEDLQGVISQACDNGRDIDSMALSSYADGMRTLAEHGRLIIDHEYGRRVIGHWPKGDDNDRA